MNWPSSPDELSAKQEPPHQPRPDQRRAIADVARTLTSHIAVAKAVKKYDLRRIITFHGRIARAREFADQFPQFLRWMPGGSSLAKLLAEKRKTL